MAPAPLPLFGILAKNSVTIAVTLAKKIAAANGKRRRTNYSRAATSFPRPMARRMLYRSSGADNGPTQLHS
jgi:hypothetical protein